MSRREPMIELIRAAATLSVPRGWTWVERSGNIGTSKDRVTEGRADFNTKTITTIEVRDRVSLYTFLHEVAHVMLCHDEQGEYGYSAEDEYEAEVYAHKLMRTLGFAVPRQCTEDAREYVRELVDKEPDAPYSDELLRFAQA